MTCLGVGIDIVLNRRLDSDPLKKRLFSNREHEIGSKRRGNLQYYGGRFAAKEAFLKAAGVGLGAIPFKAIEILDDDNGKPYLASNEIIEEFKNQKGITVVNISISHEKEYSVAVVILY
ncbi:MAG: holo-[acyl-carrier-protein] synthase [Thermotoga sp.]|nr:holo-ACP synthase [Thermotogota bacterium]RKX56223.1 MAG: holo-[acyl-carrier-protein] synthase [Thermotoga sp.]